MFSNLGKWGILWEKFVTGSYEDEKSFTEAKMEILKRDDSLSEDKRKCVESMDYNYYKNNIHEWYEILHPRNWGIGLMPEQSITKKTRVNITLDETVISEFKEIAEKTGMTVSGWIESRMKEFIEEQERVASRRLFEENNEGRRIEIGNFSVSSPDSYHLDFEKMRNEDVLPFLKMTHSHFRFDEELLKKHELEHLIKR